MSESTELAVAESMQVEATQGTEVSRSMAKVGADALSRAVNQLRDAMEFANFFTKTEMCPKAFRGKMNDAAAVILRGAQLGLDPNTSMEGFYVVNGRVGMYARTMQAVAMNAGVVFKTIEDTSEKVTIEGRRGDVVETSTWTMDDAKRAGYTTNKLYSTNPREMLWQKCIAELSRRLAPDMLLGLYSEVETAQIVENESKPRMGRAERLDKPEPAPLPELTEEQAEEAMPWLERMSNSKSGEAAAECGKEAREALGGDHPAMVHIRAEYEKVIAQLKAAK